MPDCSAARAAAGSKYLIEGGVGMGMVMIWPQLALWRPGTMLDLK